MGYLIVKLASRVRNIITRPAQEWIAIAGETTSHTELMEKYVAPLAAIAPICSFLANLLLWHRSLLVTCVLAVLAFIMEFPYVLIVASIADSAAASFGGERNPNGAVRLVAYAWTPRWLAGIFNLAPAIGAFAIPAATLYGFYLLYLGVKPIMRVPAERSTVYVVVVVAAGASVLIVVSLILAVCYAILAGAASSLAPNLFH